MFDAEYPTEARAWKAQFPEWVHWDMLCTCVWKSFAVCVRGSRGWHGGTVALGLCAVFPILELSNSFHHTLSDIAISFPTKSLPSCPPQLYPVVDWNLQNWARLNLFFIFIGYPTPLYFGGKILVCSLGWPWTPPYTSVSVSKRAGIADIHHRVRPSCFGSCLYQVFVTVLGS